VSVVGAALAAGASRRLGQPKQLLPFEGTTLIETIVSRVCATRCTRVCVIVGAHSREIARALAAQPVDVIENLNWEEGIASSLRAAVTWARATTCDGLLVSVSDQPRLSVAHLERLLARFQSHRPVASRYRDTLGVPAVFGRESFASLETLQGDRGARHLLDRLGAAPVEWPDGEIDIDAPEDLSRLSSNEMDFVAIAKAAETLKKR
jgi:CTP:molybdopterin cytidylyltransferase MocA